jgi:hypothetical protein
MNRKRDSLIIIGLIFSVTSIIFAMVVNSLIPLPALRPNRPTTEALNTLIKTATANEAGVLTAISKTLTAIEIAPTYANMSRPTLTDTPTPPPTPSPQPTPTSLIPILESTRTLPHLPTNIFLPTPTIPSTPNLDLKPTHPFLPTRTRVSTWTPIPTNSLPLTPTPKPTETIATPNLTETLQAAFDEVDRQFANSVKGNIAFIKPLQMKIDETLRVELLLNPSLPEGALAATVVEESGLPTSMADSSILESPSGGRLTLKTSRIDITPRMKAVLLSEDPDAFKIILMNDEAEKVVGSTSTTSWSWAITAKKKGAQTLVLYIYRLVRLDNENFWREVETYRAKIVVKVTVSKWIVNLDWKWWVSIIIALVSAGAGVLSWLSGRNKKTGKGEQASKRRSKTIHS